VILVTPNCWSNPPKFFSQKIWAEETIERLTLLNNFAKRNCRRAAFNRVNSLAY